MRENRTCGSEGGVSRWLIPTPIAGCFAGWVTSHPTLRAPFHSAVSQLKLEELRELPAFGAITIAPYAGCFSRRCSNPPVVFLQHR